VIIIVATAVGLAEAFSVANMPGNADNYLKLTMVFVNESIWWYISAFLLSGAGRIINGYIEDREWKHLSFPLFVFASGLILWGGSVCILSIEKDFSHGILYLLIAIIGAVIMSLIGVWISKYTMKAQAQAL
jgi:putative membrane protein